MGTLKHEALGHSLWLVDLLTQEVDGGLSTLALVSVVLDFVLSVEIQNLCFALIKSGLRLVDVVSVLLTLGPDYIHDFVLEAVVGHIVGYQRFPVDGKQNPDSVQLTSIDT